ncbi:hypothetical protein BTJ39_00295 [Izhakiella australiensis]|uniref:FimH mannose-binding domain-containing protein n=1 Tax=Izhakiella australiensis TaxID=1926881 RepID=A0A1S8YRE4_9GAMM|nr:fimbrial protein [Izhakiella australiensis]OON41644.1 hypothetical protein BTJ39_00295 [Izhakiella australiensis]
MIVALFLALFSTHAAAYLCRNKQTGQELRNGSSPVTVPLSREITAGEEVFINMTNYYECKNENPEFYDDFMYLQSDGISTVLSRDFEVGVYLNGGRYLIPAPYSQIFHLPRGADGNWHDLPMVIFYKVSERPGILTRITRGQKIATIRLYKYAHYKGGERTRRSALLYVGYYRRQ